MKNIPLGSKVKDIVSGFTGIATARHEYLNGCVRYSVIPPVGKDGKMAEAHAFDWQELEVVGKGIAVKTERDGGPDRKVPGHR